MSNENSSRNKEVSVSHQAQLRHLFKNLKRLAVSLLLAGIILAVAIPFMNFSPAVELGLLLFFGLCGALYLIGRGRSFLLQYHSIDAKIKASSKRAQESQKRE